MLQLISNAQLFESGLSHVVNAPKNCSQQTFPGWLNNTIACEVFYVDYHNKVIV